MQVQLCAPSSGPISSNTCYHMTVGTSTWLSPRKGVLFYNSLLRPAWYHDRRSRRETDRARPPTRAAGSAADPSDARNGAAAESVARGGPLGNPDPSSARPCWARISNTPWWRVVAAPNGAPPAGVLRAAAAAPLGCAVLYTVISTCRFRAAAAREGSCRSPPRPGRLRAKTCAECGTARRGSPYQYK